jgi:hypothetical protein
MQRISASPSAGPEPTYASWLVQADPRAPGESTTKAWARHRRLES